MVASAADDRRATVSFLMIKSATHLNYRDKTNLGSFYTPPHIVRQVYGLLKKFVGSNDIDVLLEPSCGYGAFFEYPFAERRMRLVGADIDPQALAVARERIPAAEFFAQNALFAVARENYGIRRDEKLVIVGNPPYNDKTSQVKGGVKRAADYAIDPDLQARDLGLSSLLAYRKLSPNFIAVLHPLSYLIKPANFRILSPLLNDYRLVDALVFSSQEFAETSKITGFPIVIAVYQQDGRGTTFQDIENWQFITLTGEIFSLNRFDYISRYLAKYPQKVKREDYSGHLFYTMRDINALKRSRTFIAEDMPNAVQIDSRQLQYYHYVDVFKNYVDQIPYYLGNFNIPIDHPSFLRLADDFEVVSKSMHPDIFADAPAVSPAPSKARIDDYFQRLFSA